MVECGQFRLFQVGPHVPISLAPYSHPVRPTLLASHSSSEDCDKATQEEVQGLGFEPESFGPELEALPTQCLTQV